MKWAIFLLLTTILGFYPKEGFKTCSVAGDGLVAYYSFNNCDARDDSGNGSNGEMYGGVQCWCGIEDDGLLLDGVQDYIEFEGLVNAYFSTSDFTLSYYIKPEQYSVFQQSLISKRGECNFDHVLDMMLDLGAGEISTVFHESDEKYYSNLSPQVDSLGWVHFALVREGTMASTYINGQLQRRAFKCSGVDISNNANLTFGKSPCVEGGRARFFKGVIDELRVYERALNPDEIELLYKQNPVENSMMDCLT